MQHREDKRKKGKNKDFEVITIYCPRKYLDLLEKLVGLKIYPSRSECIRAMMGEWLSAKISTIENLDMLIAQADKVLEYNKNATQRHLEYKNKRKIQEDIKVYILSNEEIVEDNKGSKTRVREYFRADHEIIDDDEYEERDVPTEEKYINEDDM